MSWFWDEGRIACYLFIPGSRDGIPPFAARLAFLTTKSCHLAEGIVMVS